MKRIIIINITHRFVFLFLSLIGVGCEKKDTYDPDSIVGKWQIIQYPEICPGFDRMIEITVDSVFKSYVDGKIDFISTFNIKPGTLGYDTILYHDYAGYYRWELIALKGSDTLHLIPPLFTAIPICNYYKRRN
jgi:hypothetical protein